MIGDLFDSPWKILIVAIVIIVLFGSAKLPVAARSLGRSMRILKSEVQGMHHDEPGEPVQATVQPAPAQLQTTETVTAQAQLDALQKQLADLQQTVGANGTVSANGTVPADTQQAQ
ncbi:MAG TPA: Sec-independent protein translocase subunit TatA [Trebonia sp.]|jgi:sec-independent protein translocase protein TatA|nr:Sec-independent protein translocase subunit TatA [Trebonia sp.]